MPLTAEAREQVVAATAELRRRHACNSLIGFTKATFPQYRAEAAHRLIAHHLDRVVAGECRRLMIFAPPQHGKSELSSVRLPAYWMGKRPDDPVILTSYGADHAYRLSRHARQCVESDEYQGVFPGIKTQGDSRAVDHWELEGHRGGLLATGVGGPITGQGAMLGIIDDPVKGWEQAQSVTYRDSTWDWYLSTFRTRIWEGGAIVVLMTRWHEDDLAGRLLAQDSDQWEVLRLPATSEGEGDPLGRPEGEPLAPLRFSAEELARIEAEVQSVVWAGEYQGLPVAPGGNLFKRPDFGTVLPERPAFLTHWVRYWDKASVEGGGDYSAGVLMGRGGNIYYVLDVVRGQWSPSQRNIVIRQTTEQDAATCPRYSVWVEQEPGSGGKESALNTVSELAGYDVHAETVTGSKIVRATPVAAQVEVGNLKLIKDREGRRWNAAYIDEMCAFPNGKHDDMVDGTSGSFAKLATNVYKSGMEKYA